MDVTNKEIIKNKKMKRNSVIFGVLCSLLVMTMVKTEKVEATDKI